MPTFDFPPRIQFNLRGLLIAVALIAVLFGLFTIAQGLFGWLIAIVVIWILPTPLVAAAVYARGDLRAFAIGALVPWFSLWATQHLGGSFLDMFGKTIELLILAGICGSVAVATRRWIERKNS
jgi:hypothetical protein